MGVVKKIVLKAEYRVFKKGMVIELRDDINLLVGDQGAGKSTLLKALSQPNEYAAFEFVTDGSVGTKFFDTESGNPRVTQSNLDIKQKVVSKFSSHGETMKPIVLHCRHIKDSVILIDEPESGLSIRSQLEMIEAFKEAVANKCQLIIATHSPILMQSVDAVYSVEHKKWMSPENFILSQHKKQKTKRK